MSPPELKYDVTDVYIHLDNEWFHFYRNDLTQYIIQQVYDDRSIIEIPNGSYIDKASAYLILNTNSMYYLGHSISDDIYSLVQAREETDDKEDLSVYERYMQQEKFYIEAAYNLASACVEECKKSPAYEIIFTTNIIVKNHKGLGSGFDVNIINKYLEPFDGVPPLVRGTSQVEEFVSPHTGGPNMRLNYCLCKVLMTFYDDFADFINFASHGSISLHHLIKQ